MLSIATEGNTDVAVLKDRAIGNGQALQLARSTEIATHPLVACPQVGAASTLVRSTLSKV